MASRARRCWLRLVLLSARIAGTGLHVRRAQFTRFVEVMRAFLAKWAASIASEGVNIFFRLMTMNDQMKGGANRERYTCWLRPDHLD